MWTNDSPGIGLPASGIGNIPDFTAINKTNGQVVATIIATPISTGFVYIANRSSNSVSIINAATNVVVSTIVVNAIPSGVSINPDGSMVYISMQGSSGIWVFSTATNKVLYTIPVQNPYALAFSPNGSFLYVGNDGSSSVTVINTASHAVTSKIALVGNPYGLSMSPDGAKLYVALEANDEVAVIDTKTNKVINTLATGPVPWGLATSIDGSKLYVAESSSSAIEVFNTTTNSIITNIYLGYLAGPIGITLSPDGNYLYVANDFLNTVSVINTATNSVVSTIPVGNNPYGISISPDGTKVYTTNYGSNNVSVISTASNAVIATISVGLNPDSFGNFATSGVGCSAAKLTITVNPTNALPQTITTSLVTGSINACAGTASANPQLQQFSVSGTNLTGNVIATAPAGFEVSTSPGGSYSGTVTLSQTGGALSNITVYVRSAASAPTGNLTGQVIISSAGAANQTVTVTATVNALPTVNKVTNQTVTNGAATSAVNFTGTGTMFSWTNNTPAIGLAATGTGNIASFTAINTSNSPVVATVTVSPSFQAAAYLANESSTTVSVININTNAVIATIPVGSSPFGVSVSPDGKYVYVGNTGSNSISVISTATNTVIATIPVGSQPFGVLVSTDGSKVYVANYSAGSVSVISTATYKVIATISTGIGAYGIAASPDGSKIYVANQGSATVSVINTATNKVLVNVPVGINPIGLSVNPDGGSVYVANSFSNNVSVINTSTNKVIATIGVGKGPVSIIISKNGEYAYVVNQESGSVSVVNTATNTIISTITVGSLPFGASLNPDGSQLYVTNEGSNTVSVINTLTNAVITTIPVGSNPDSFGNFIMENNSCSGTPVNFTITVNPTLIPVIIAGSATGTITACTGTVSSSPDIQQFTVSGSELSGNINAIAPTGFEVSLAPGSGYGNAVTIPETGGTANTTFVYVRSASADPAGSISGNVTLTSTGAPSQTVAITGTINAIPTVNVVPNQIVSNGGATTAVNFTGTGKAFTWVNDTPGIGLAGSGSGNIGSFTSVNTGNNPETATITVTPLSPNNFIGPGKNCPGPPITFTITVNPDIKPTIIVSPVTGTITSCSGTASASPNIQQFMVSGVKVTDNIAITAPAGFELSLTSGSNYGSSLVLSQTDGTVNNTLIYVRSAAADLTGTISGNILLSSTGAATQIVAVNGIVNALPALNAVISQTVNNGTVTAAVNFTGTGDTFTWVNNMPGIDLPANGVGNIASFVAINTGTTPIIATVTVTPSSSVTGCTGTPVSFTFTVNPFMVIPPALTHGLLSGTIAACSGTASVSPYIQQFTLSGSNLISNVNAGVSSGFEISTDPNSGYGSSLILLPTSEAINTIIYIRAAATAASGTLTGTVDITSSGLQSEVSVNGIVNPLPVIGPVLPQQYINGNITQAITFVTNGNNDSWTNDTPGIGLAAGGTGNIPSFTALNTGSNPIIAHISVLPSAPTTGCSGTPVIFTIEVDPVPFPVISATGNPAPLTTVYGTPSPSDMFSVSATALTAGISISPPVGFELSTDDQTFNNTVTVGAPGTLSSTNIFIRLAAVTPGWRLFRQYRINNSQCFQSKYLHADKYRNPCSVRYHR